MRTYLVEADSVENHPWGTLPAINTRLNEILGRVLNRIYDDGSGVNLSNYFVGVGDLEFDVKDNDGTVYRISRHLPLGANPKMRLNLDGGGYILTHWSIPSTVPSYLVNFFTFVGQNKTHSSKGLTFLYY